MAGLNRYKENDELIINKNKTRISTKFKLTLIIILVIVAILLTLYISGYRNATKKYQEIINELENTVEQLSEPIAVYDNADREVAIDLITSEIRNIGELATVEYLYTDAGKFEDPMKLFGKELKLGLTTKHFIAKWDGIIKAGVNLDNVTVEIRKLSKEIIVYLPKAEILSHEIDQNSIETLDEKDGFFNRISVEDVREFDAVTKESMESRAIENGILDKAVENAEDIITKLIYTDIIKKQGYTIDFVINND